MIPARNGLESYLYQVQHSLSEYEKNNNGDDGLFVDADEREDVMSLIQESLTWLDHHRVSDIDGGSGNVMEAEDYLAKQKEVEQVVKPILRKLSQQQQNAGKQDQEQDQDQDFGDEEL